MNIFSGISPAILQNQFICLCVSWMESHSQTVPAEPTEHRPHIVSLASSIMKELESPDFAYAIIGGEAREQDGRVGEAIG